jgi:hypothetical protein
MKLIKTLFLNGFLAFIVASGAIAFAQNRQQPFPDFGVQESQQDTVVNWSAIRPSANHVTLVMDAQASNSLGLISHYKSKAYDGQGLMIIVIGVPQNARAFISAQRTNLPQANWYIATPQVLSIALKLAGTPHFFGVTQDGQIAWNYAGLPPSSDRSVALVRDWIIKPSMTLQKIQ